MDTLCINNVTIYPGIKPPKGIVHSEFKMENLTMWITKCKNLYFNSENPHPISKYGLSKPTYLLSHLFFIVRDIIFQQLEKEADINWANNFLFGCLEFLRVNSSNAYCESLEDPMITRIFLENYIAIPMNPLTISYFNFKSKSIKFQHHTLKNNVVKSFDKFNKDFQKMSNDILERISENVTKEKIVVEEKIVVKEKIIIQEVEKKITKENKEIQTMSPNSWKAKPIIKSDISTQTLLNGNSIEIQVDIPIQKEETKIVETKSKKKKKEEIIELTESEYARIMKEMKDQVSKAKEQGYLEYSKNFMKFVTSAKLPVAHLYNILKSSEADKAMDAILVFVIDLVSRNFRLSIIDEGYGMKIKIPPFVRFWKEVIVPRIDDWAHPVFKILNQEWKLMENTLKESKVQIEDNKINILFGHYATIILTDCWDLQCFIPSFFNLILRRCRNIPFLIGIVTAIEDKPTIPIEQYKYNLANDFQLLYLLPSDRDIIESNREILKLDDPGTLSLLNLGDKKKV